MAQADVKNGGGTMPSDGGCVLPGDFRMLSASKIFQDSGLSGFGHDLQDSGHRGLSRIDSVWGFQSGSLGNSRERYRRKDHEVSRQDERHAKQCTPRPGIAFEYGG